MHKKPLHFAGRSLKIVIRLIRGFLLLLGIFGGLISIILFIKLRLLNPSEYESNKARWSKFGGNDYTITLLEDGLGYIYPDHRIEMEYKTKLIVHDGNVVSVENIVCKQCSIADYQQFTIGSLFEAASECIYWMACRVKYDPEYGFPTVIFSGIIEGVGTRISDFKLLNKLD